MEIIENLRKMLDAGIISKEDIERAFPQLAESEDERIRKAILGLTYLDGIEPILTKCSITRQKIRSYLEKQKLTNDITESSFRMQECLSESSKPLKIKQNKPAEWSEKDKEIIDNLRHILNAYAYEHCGMDVNGDYIEQNYIDADNWLKSLRPQPHWKPSEEQIDAIHEANFRCRAYQFATHLTEIEIQLEKLMNE